jgi:hypothetical protein
MVAILEIGAFSEQIIFFVACPSRTDAILSHVVGGGICRRS